MLKLAQRCLILPIFLNWLAKINIPEGQISNIAVGGLADITVPAYPDDKFSGMITRISPVADMPARTFAAEVTVDNSAGKLRGGVYANVVVAAEPKKRMRYRYSYERYCNA